MPPTFFKTPSHFRKWLDKYHQKNDELWVGFYKTASGKPSITWPQSVDQALCFGWIDGIRKSIDDEAYMIRFTPRRVTSIWSAVNIKKFADLKAAGLLTPAGQAAYDAKKDTHTNRYSFEQDTVTFLPEYEKMIKANKKAWAYFQSLPPSTKKPTIWWVMSANQKETQFRRLAILIANSEKGQKIPPLVVLKRK